MGTRTFCFKVERFEGEDSLRNSGQKEAQINLLVNQKTMARSFHNMGGKIIASFIECLERSAGSEMNGRSCLRLEKKK